MLKVEGVTPYRATANRLRRLPARDGPATHQAPTPLPMPKKRPAPRLSAWRGVPVPGSLSVPVLGMGEAHVSEAQLTPFLIAAAVSPPRVEGAGGLADLAQAVQA